MNAPFPSPANDGRPVTPSRLARLRVVCLVALGGVTPILAAVNLLNELKP
jgi:hypothetical protein